ncbi:MAG: glycosyltransferase [Thermomicrobiales bacterium]
MTRRRTLAPGVAPRIVFYTHDGLGLGHFRRTVLVAQALVARVPTAAPLLVTGMPAGEGVSLPPELEYVRLPGLDKRHLFTGLPHDKHAPREVFAVRQAMLSAVLQSFAPHLVLVDHAPAGLAEELQPLLRARPKHGRAPRFVLGLRDITYGPKQTRAAWARADALALMDEVYDEILIYGCREVYDPIRTYGLPKRVARKTRFTGYLRPTAPLRPPDDVRAELGAAGGPLVAASVGGGVDGADVLTALLHASAAGLLPEVALSLVTGPQMPLAEQARLADLAAGLPGVSLATYRDDYLSHVAAADVVVTMGGYNSVWEAIGQGQRPIVIPRDTRSDEQQVRAQRLAELGLATVLQPHDLTPQQLASAILAELAAPPPVPPPWLDFTGLEHAATALAAALARSTQPARH